MIGSPQTAEKHKWGYHHVLLNGPRRRDINPGDLQFLVQEEFQTQGPNTKAGKKQSITTVTTAATKARHWWPARKQTGSRIANWGFITTHPAAMPARPGAVSAQARATSSADDIKSPVSPITTQYKAGGETRPSMPCQGRNPSFIPTKARTITPASTHKTPPDVWRQNGKKRYQQQKGRRILQLSRG
jgi:hypothetical protein